MIAVAWVVVGAWAGVELEKPQRAGAETVIAVTDQLGEPRSGETVRVIHRPGLAGQRELAVGITDGRGRVRWVPEQAGIARLRAGEEPHDVRVAWAATPPAVPILLGLLGLGALLALGYGLGAGRRR